MGGTWSLIGTMVPMPFGISSPADGSYCYTVSNGFCNSFSYVNLTNIIPDLTQFTFTPQTIVVGQSVVNFTNMSSEDSVRWFIDGVYFGELNSFSHTFLPEGNKEVCLVLYTDNCIDTICQIIKVNGIPNLYIPNSFSPNEDGLNDMFGPIFTGKVDYYEFTVFNRWGEIVFYTKDVSDFWDGKYLNNYVKNDSYTWKITYKHSITSEVFRKFGHVQIIK